MLTQMFNLILKLVNFYLDRREKKTKQKDTPADVDFEFYIHINKGKE